jgi:hypothetical protein
MAKPSVALLGLAALTGGCGHKSTYAEGCGPLPDGWITPRQGRGVLSIVSVISVAADGNLTFNGARLSEPKLGTYLKQSSEMNPMPVTQVKFAPGLDCDTVRRLRRLMVRTLDCRFGYCAEGDGKWWMIGDVIVDGPPKPYDPDAPSPPADDR